MTRLPPSPGVLKASTIESEFVAYRLSGDPDRLAEVFDQTAPRLLRLALHLAACAADAEDLVQATYLRAMEIAERYTAGRPLLPWLCGILELEARHLRRSSNRRVDPDRLEESHPDPVVEPIEGLERRELRSRIEAALGDLPVIYRTVVTLKLQHGLTPLEIAAALERSPVAVRSQLHRGLRMLRAALPQGVAMAVVGSVTAGRGLAAVRGAVLQQAIVSAGLKQAVSGLTVGALMLKQLVVLVCTVLVLAMVIAILYSVWPGQDLKVAKGGVVPRAADVSGSAQGSGVSRGLVVRTGLEVRREVELDLPGGMIDPAVAGSLHLVVRYEGESNASVPGVAVSVVRDNGTSVTGLPSFTDADGGVSVGGLSPGRWLVRLDREGPTQSLKAGPKNRRIVVSSTFASARVEVFAGAESELEMRVKRETRLMGQVVDASGKAVAGASIWCALFSQRPHPANRVAESDAEGRFELQAVGKGHWIAARHPDYGPSGAFSPWQEDGSGVEIRLRLADVGGGIGGRVIDSDGRQVSGAELIVGRDLFNGGMDRRSDGIWTDNAVPGRLVTGTDGVYAMSGLAGGQQFVWVRAGGYVAQVIEVKIEAREVTGLDIHLDLGATVVGRIVDPERVALHGVKVSAWPVNGDSIDPGTGYPRALASTMTSPDGGYRLVGLPGGVVRIRAAAYGSSGFETLLETKAGAVSTFDIELVPNSDIHGSVSDASGRRLRRWRIVAEPLGGGDSIRAALGEDGSFQLATDRDAAYRLVIERPRIEELGGKHGAEAQLRIPCIWLGEVEGNRGQVDIRIPEFVCAFGGVRGQMGGLPLDAGTSWVTVHSGAPKIRHTVCAIDSEGRFDTGALVSGEYRLVLHMLGPRAVLMLGEWTVAAGASVDIGLRPMPSVGKVELVLKGISGSIAVHADLYDEQGRKVSSLYAAEGSLTARLVPGRYKITPWTMGQYGGGSHWDGKSFDVTVSGVTVVEFDSAEKR